MVEDLRICSVKFADELERRFCFEVVTPTRSSMLQAESEALRKKWSMYLEAGIARALRGSASNKVSRGMGPLLLVVITFSSVFLQRKEEVREKRRLGSSTTHSSTPTGSLTPHLDSPFFRMHQSRPDTPSSVISK